MSLAMPLNFFRRSGSRVIYHVRSPHFVRRSPSVRTLESEFLCCIWGYGSQHSVFPYSAISFDFYTSLFMSPCALRPWASSCYSCLPKQDIDTGLIWKPYFEQIILMLYLSAFVGKRLSHFSVLVLWKHKSCWSRILIIISGIVAFKP